MVRITEELIRKKSEHNELMISTLEEISLHQENIEKIEHIQNWCKDLKILLLQSNLISKIENLNKLKKLEYLNLAINNIERIENLEGLESLKKLDLTLNFIGELTSIESLIPNYNLSEIHLIGNPCCDCPEYRDYLIATLPQLNNLDGVEITRTDRIRALREIAGNRKRIVQWQAEYQIERDLQKIRVQKDLEEAEGEVAGILDEEEKLKRFWNRKSENCPETRCQIAKYSKRNQAKQDVKEKQQKTEVTLFAPCGRPYNLNRAKLEFDYTDEQGYYELNLHIYKFLDTSLINVDLQPNYVRVTAKGKIFQLVLNDEINVSKSTSQRSMTTGHLLIVMPKLNYDNILQPAVAKNEKEAKFDEKQKQRELIGTVDYKNIINTGIEIGNKNICDKDGEGYDDMPSLI